MDKPADPAMPFAEVHQAFLSDPAVHGNKPSALARYRYNIERSRTVQLSTGFDPCNTRTRRDPVARRIWVVRL